MIKEAIAQLTEGKDLSSNQMKAVFEELLTGVATHAQAAAFLIALKIKGETEEEIAAAAEIVRKHSVKISARKNLLDIEELDEIVMDTCGTGGSGMKKFNVSTATALVVAAAGFKVAKHGNRAMSGHCGSADVLEDLGVKIDADPKIMEESIKSLGIGFLFAPLYHPAFKHVVPVRKEIGVKTIFNILGPLCNPAQTSHQVMGVYCRDMVMIAAKVLKRLKIKKALIVHSQDLKDEISLSSKTYAAFLNNGKITSLTLGPKDFGLKKIKIKDIQIGSRFDSARMIKEILAGKKCPARDMVLASAAACFYVLGNTKNFKEGVKLAASMIDDGLAAAKLEKFREITNR